MKTATESNQIISINDTKINTAQIVERIRESIKKNKIAYLKKINSKLTGIIDTTENSEFLVSGWHENESICGQRARWTKKQASFLFNSGHSGIINLEIVATPPLGKEPLVITLFVGKKKIADKLIKSPQQQIISFLLPKIFQNKNIQPALKLSRTFCPMKEGLSSDFRNLGIAIKKISNIPITEIGSKYIPQLIEYESFVPLELEKIKYHINPENLLPSNTPLKFIKKIILRVIKVYTSVQIGFNSYTLEFLRKTAEHILKLSSYVKDIDHKVSNNETGLKRAEDDISLIKNSYKLQIYKPLFWEDDKDSFYIYHQDFFRGSYKDTQKKLSFYLKYIDPKYAPFIDIGCGRGEFIELLKNKNIPAVGVDVNYNYVKSIKEKGMAAVCTDAISFLGGYKGKIGGISAMHVLEHLTFPQIYDFIKQSHQKLTSEGILIIETPNPNNLTVGTTNFFYDFTHITKLPPLLLQKTMEYVGFMKIKTIYFRPEKRTKTEIGRRIFGPQDYAILGYKQ